MIRFISFLLGKQYEPCKGCEVLKQQLLIANEEKKQLTQTLIEIVKPRPPEPHQIVPGQTIPIPTVASFSRRRAILEQRDRETLKTAKESPFIAVPDNKTIDETVNNLEKELGIEQPSETESV